MENKLLKAALSRRKAKDITANVFTGLSSFISVIILLSILLFVFIRGWSSLDFRMITSDYYETAYFATAETTEGTAFDLTDKDGIYYSNVYGIGLKDDEDLEGNACITIVYIDDNSPLLNAVSQTDGTKASVTKGQIIKRVQVETSSGNKVLTAKIGASAMADGMDEGYQLNELYYATMGGGIRGSLLTTLWLILLTLVIVMPIGIIAAVYLAVYAKKNRFTGIIRSLIDMIAGIPSIIFGLIGVIIFIPIVSGVSGNSGGSILSGAFTMAVMLLPTVISTTEESIYNIPEGYRLSSLALGASETQTTFRVILPNAIPGILTALLLSIGRIIGESAALIFAIGTAIQDKVSVFKGSTTLAVHIWTVMSGENPNYGMACAISIIILVVVLVLNITVKLISKKLNRFEVK